MTYAELYRWFTETTGLGLAEQSAQLMHPKAAAKEEDIAAAIELWESVGEAWGRLRAPECLQESCVEKYVGGEGEGNIRA